MKPIVLCILDGVGIAADGPHNAVSRAAMPFYNSLLADYPHAALSASGAAVGLPPGTMGNSEVGHITIGAGRVVNQFLRRFQVARKNNEIAGNDNLQKFIADVDQGGGVVNLVAMMSDGRVHSDISDIIFVAKIICAFNLPLAIHFIADGRDTPPRSAQKYINKIKRELSGEIADGRAWFATLSGRYYAMDRNGNDDRTQLAIDAIANGKSEFSASTINRVLNAAYARGEADEFIKPTVIKNTKITNRDGILFANYRADRARQILRELAKTGAHMLSFSQYGEGLDDIVPAILDDIKIENTLGDVLAANGKSQLRIAETEKYNHVTFFFDAERSIDYEREEKILIASPAVATFNMRPEMSAAEITDALLPRLAEFDVVILNYANGDMVGHTGNMAAAVAAMEALDAQLARLVPAVLQLDGTILITADHGNAEQMRDKNSAEAHTAHTTNPVPFIVVSNRAGRLTPRAARAGLADIAPTILHLLNLPQPSDMTGKSLI